MPSQPGSPGVAEFDRSAVEVLADRGVELGDNSAVRIYRIGPSH
jgi:hypothetical protein